MKNICLLMFIIGSVGAFAQSELRPLSMLEGDTLVRAKIFVKNPEKFKAKKGKMYFWYHKDRLLGTEAAYSGLLLEGLYERFYPNQNLLEKGFFHKGLKNGLWQKWWENGRLKEELNWKKGQKKGILRRYNAAGQLIEKGQYRKGKLHGKYYFFDPETGRCIQVERYKKGEKKVTKPKKERKKQPAKAKKPKPAQKEKKPKTKKKAKQKKKSATTSSK
ncbi:hypothetical protein PPO43_01545 [Saprospira sp. CCB-QB6]|uniref:toxin-antitoxin system YwqK family antitoxin n=1 Tax=Saprospira sp. CCB-QB6 TaxID=3023936 RepID=UPI00234B3445|nr:hypothetical protein [Saprospira sp. CCB-QB6]WCL81780.1 hypothetical protein PPO43_01545 [Saprospira sp. CCB-QB6]